MERVDDVDRWNDACGDLVEERDYIHEYTRTRFASMLGNVL